MTGTANHSNDAELAELARETVVWGFPLVLFGRYLDAAMEAGVPYNEFFMNTEIASPQSRSVGPNIDTLNGRAWLDLSSEPQVIVVPDTDDRYYSIHLQDMYTNSFAYIGRRTYGTQASAFAITPPGFEGTLPQNVTEIRATTTKVFAFVRTLVRSVDDLPSVREINGRFSIGPLSDYPAGQRPALVRAGAIDAFQPKSRREGKALPHQEIQAAGIGYFGELDRLVHAFPPPLPADQQRWGRFAALGLGKGAPAERDDTLSAVLAAAVPEGVALAMNSLEDWSDNGWSRRRNVAQFIDDPVQRAANTVYGPGTQVAEESVFFNLLKDPDGRPLTGARCYRLHFPPGQTPPVDAFWSLTLYDRRYFLVDNPIDRYGITDRTQGLRYEPDGSLDILIQAEQPAEGISNWLPSPPEEFELIIRTYQPRREILEYAYHPPRIEVADCP
jgi:hypothetical protein